MKCYTCGYDFELGERKYRIQTINSNKTKIYLCDDDDSACAVKRSLQ